MRRQILALAVAALAAGCAGQAGRERPQAASARPAGPPPQVVAIPADPYPSTYRPLPSRPTLIRNARVYDGKGGELSGASILMRDGKVAAI
ncbi:MAG: amidohydrolase, partial [Sphingomonadaceae bacterium]